MSAPYCHMKMVILYCSPFFHNNMYFVELGEHAMEVKSKLVTS